MQAPDVVQVGRRTYRRSSYVTIVVTFATLGVMLSAFDSVARNDALPLILKSLHISVATGGLIFSGGFLATFLSYLVVGPLMDRIGRKRTFLLALAATAVFSGATAFVTNTVQYAIIGFLAGVCLSVEGVAAVIASEEVPTERRGVLLGIIQAGFAVGTIVVGAVGAVILATGNWRLLFLLAFAPIVIVILASGLFREPPRSTEALAVKRQRQKIAQGQIIHTTFAIDEKKAVQSEWKQIFDRDLRRQTIVTSIFGLLVNFSTGFVLALGVTFITSYDKLSIAQASFSLTVEGAATLVGTIIIGYLADWIPSRNLLIIWSIVGGIAVALFAVKGHLGWILFVMALFGFFGQGVLGCWNRYLNESFPTRVRGTGSSFVNGIFFVGLAFAPAIYGAIMATGYYPGAAFLAGGAPVVGALVFLLAKVIPPKKELEELAI
ncbi:MAG: MFS transporter [Firmicutes bacterium]|nr:MFS transporter [Bacillota bacterium]